MMHGRSVCAWCSRDLGGRPGIPAGKVSHGICARCADAVSCGVEGGQGRSAASVVSSGRALAYVAAALLVLALVPFVC